MGMTNPPCPLSCSSCTFPCTCTKYKTAITKHNLRSPMCTDRRDFLRLSAASVAGVTLLGTASAHQGNQPEPIRRLKRMTDKAIPITLEERKGRIEKAQKLMRDNRIGAIYLEPGTSMSYFTGMRWGTSERMFGA